MYHIHEHPVPADGNCDGTGMHFNPYRAPEFCNAQPDDSYCQVGDLSGKHGWINTTCFEAKYSDAFLSLNPKSKAYIVGRSIVFHYADMTKFACANINYATEEQLAQLAGYNLAQTENVVLRKFEDSEEFSDNSSWSGNWTNATVLSHESSSEAKANMLKSGAGVALGAIIGALL